MQIRPETASLLGYRGTADGLFEPETNLRYSIAYLAGAWRQANGDLCRALMKYRAGHGEERMSPASAEYCRRARVFLASTGSVLGENSISQASAPAEAHLAVQPQEIRRVVAAGIFPVGVPLPPRRPESTRVASAAVALFVSTSNRSPAGEEANSSNNAARQLPLVTAAQARGAQATAAKTLPAVGAPLPPRRPEPESTRLALVKVGLSTAQMSASIQPRAVAPITSPARFSPPLAAKAQGARPAAVRSRVNVPLPPRRPEPESARAAIKLAAQISVSSSTSE